MSDDEVVTLDIVSAIFFAGNRQGRDIFTRIRLYSKHV